MFWGMDSELVGAILGPLVTALLAGIAVGWRQIRQRRSSDVDFERLWQEAAFLDAMLSARSRLAPLDAGESQAFSNRLDRLSGVYRSLSDARVKANAGPGYWGRLWRVVTLAGLQGAPATTFRVFYLLWLVIGVLMSFVWSWAASTTNDGPAWASFFAGVLLSVLSYLPALACALIAHYLSGRARLRADLARRHAQAQARHLQGTSPGGWPSSPDAPGSWPSPAQNWGMAGQPPNSWGTPTPPPPYDPPRAG